MDSIELSLFGSRIAAICDEMGAVLQRAAFSPNIRDRLDFSCALFDARGELCAQAAHIPVHLGSMAYAMADIVRRIDWQAGDMVIVNDPFLGGTHLPDVTLIAPVFVQAELLGFVANRAHHADIGADAPGSMPISSRLEEEGQIIPPQKIVRANVLDQALLERLLAASRGDGHEGRGDLSAQISANHCGVRRLVQLIEPMSAGEFLLALAALQAYGERLARSVLRHIPDGVYEFTDYLDDDGLGQEDIVIKARITVQGDDVEVDFSGTAAQVRGNVNCPLSVAAAAVYYVFRCLMPAQTPACAGSFRPLRLRAPEGCLLNARRPAAVAAGNVETSSRIVDVVMGALAQALPDKLAAASQGSMNNLAMGGDVNGRAWDYYETIGGGMGASPAHDGMSAVQTHMTNTLNTPIEVLEARYPLRIRRYAVREGSGGQGRRRGGDGIIREFEFLQPASVTVISERRRHAPWGLQ
ncbi:MAG: hydantoinase B/oxoprolinase family protein, partial [Gammaproteobacteria bacterium]